MNFRIDTLVKRRLQTTRNEASSTVQDTSSASPSTEPVRKSHHSHQSECSPSMQPPRPVHFMPGSTSAQLNVSSENSTQTLT